MILDARCLKATLADKSKSDVQLADPLSEVTRKERRFFLGVSILGITLVQTGLVPSKISALGIEFAQADQQSLLSILALVVTYFLVAFVIYAAADFLAWRRAITRSLRQSIIESKQQKHVMSDDEWYEIESRINQKFGYVVFRLSGLVSIIRAIFEFVLPVIVGVYAIILLATAEPPPTIT